MNRQTGRSGPAFATRRKLLAVLLALSAPLARGGEPAAADAARLFAQHCALCHGADRLGASGPALLPENLERLNPAQAERVIALGRAATQMPAFADRLDSAGIAALAAWLYTPVQPAPQWDEAAMRASRVVHAAPAESAAPPVYAADPLNLFVVVEAGDSHVSILDGERFERLARFPSRFALHGGPKFSPDGRYVYFVSRDGWVSQYDLHRLARVAEIRVALNSRNLAVSADGRWVAVANTLPPGIVVLDAALQPQRSIEVRSETDGRTSRVAAIYDAGPRRSFIAALRDLPELWELPHEAAAGGTLAPRRIALQAPMEDFFFDPGYRHAIGASRAGGQAHAVALDSGRRVAELPVAGLPHLASGISWQREGRTVLASPNLREPVISVIDLEAWRELARIPALGPGFFLRSHSASPYAWADAMMSPRKDSLLVIDKRSLQPVATVVPAPGKTAAHVEFDRSGRHVVVSIWERMADGGALVVLDAQSLREIKRIPADKPVGKYNVWNKLSRDDGTSH